MSTEKDETKKYLHVGFGITGAYAILLAVLTLLNLYGDGSNFFLGNRLNEIGDFLAGAFAPLAFAWLVIGYFMQAAEFKLQRKEFEVMQEEARATTKAVEYQGATADESVKP